MPGRAECPARRQAPDLDNGRKQDEAQPAFRSVHRVRLGLLSFPKNKPPKYAESDIGGTSLASPLVAGIVAAAQQGQHTSFGLIHAAVCTLVKTRAIHDARPLTRHSPSAWKGTACDEQTCGIQVLTTFDDQNPNMFGYFGQVTLKSYDNMSGSARPRGSGLSRPCATSRGKRGQGRAASVINVKD
jgi:hypothetical protein